MIYDVLNKLSLLGFESKTSERIVYFIKKLISKIDFRESAIFILIILFAAKAINFYVEYLL